MQMQEDIGSNNGGGMFDPYDAYSNSGESGSGLPRSLREQLIKGNNSINSLEVGGDRVMDSRRRSLEPLAS